MDVWSIVSLVTGVLVLLEFAAFACQTWSAYKMMKKIEQVKQKIKEIPVDGESTSKSSRNTKSKSGSKKKKRSIKEKGSEKSSKSRRGRSGRDLFDAGVDLNSVVPFTMPEATHQRTSVPRLKDPETLIDCADQLTAFIKKYKDNVANLPVSCDVLPGFLAHRLPTHPPEKRERFQDILADFYNLLLPGMNHWQHPRFLAPQMAGPSVPDSVAEMMCSQISTIGFSWDSSPSCNELDVVMSNWAGRALGIPEQFLFQGNTEFSPGGGTITESVADSHLCMIMSCRWTTTNRLLVEDGRVDKESDGYLVDPKTAEDTALHHSYYRRLVVYGNQEAHPSLEKICRLSMLHCRKIPSLPRNNFGMSAEQLEAQMMEDIQLGLVPCCVLVTLGLRGLLTDDHLEELAFVAKKYNCWLHVDASEVAGFWVEPSLRPPAAHLGLADSILAHLRFHSVNVMVLWNRNQKDYKMGYYINPSYLRGTRLHQFNPRDWTMHLSRRVRSLKMFFTYTMIGRERMKNHIRKLVLLAEQLRAILKTRNNIKLFGKQRNNAFSFQYAEPGMNDNQIYQYTKKLGKFINESKQVMLKTMEVVGTAVLIVAINYEYSTEETIKEVADVMIKLIEEFSCKKDQLELLKFPATPQKSSAVTPTTARS